MNFSFSVVGQRLPRRLLILFNKSKLGSCQNWRFRDWFFIRSCSFTSMRRLRFWLNEFKLGLRQEWPLQVWFFILNGRPTSIETTEILIELTQFWLTSKNLNHNLIFHSQWSAYVYRDKFDFDLKNLNLAHAKNDHSEFDFSFSMVGQRLSRRIKI